MELTHRMPLLLTSRRLYVVGDFVSQIYRLKTEQTNTKPTQN